MPTRPILGIDIGGTFTDLQLRAGSRSLSHKVISTPERFATGLLQGTVELLRRAREEGLLAEGSTVPVRHGGTVATNAFLERRGARVALLCTRGFEDLLEIGRQQRPALYDLDVERPPPVVAREACFGIPERVDSTGQVLLPLDTAALDGALDQVQAQGYTSVAIAFLFSFLHPEHELTAAGRARARGLTVSASVEILPEFREYERTSTTAINAFVGPVVVPYLRELERGLQELEASPLWIFSSAGTLLSCRAACERPVLTLLSGPAGGVVGAWAAARRAGHERILTCDMGGTSTDVALCAGEPELTHGGLLDGLPVQIPRLDLHTVGAGGGSIAWLDPGGALRVGPRSAGASPGPACYGLGGAEPTLSDASLILGRMVPDRFLGGRMTLQPDRAREALAPLARSLGVSLPQAAEDILAVAVATMARALRAISVERGHDLRELTLVAFGGAGGMHAASLARILGLTGVLIPPDPGVLSASGMTLAEMACNLSRTVMRPGGADLEGDFQSLEARVCHELQEEGLDQAEMQLERRADLRYDGQSYELVVEAGTSEAPVPPDLLVQRFHQQHRHRFGHAEPELPVQVVTLRVRGSRRQPGDSTPALPAPGARPAPPPSEVRPALFEGRELPTAIHDRAQLEAGHHLQGPAIILEDHATTVVPPQTRLDVDAHLNLHLRLEELA